MEDGGIDILAVKHMLNYAHSEDNEVSMWVSYIEIYNEVINDLLDISGTNLKVREDSTSTIGSYVEGWTVWKLRDFDHFIDLLNKGESNRQYAKTLANENYSNTYSSRSHTIIRIVRDIFIKLKYR